VPDEVKNYTASIFIASIPPIAKVYMDGIFIGKTNLSKLRVKPGTHKMRFEVNGDSREIEMTFEKGDNRSELVKIR
jgi:phosphatidate phosphatase PAH1